MVGKCSPFNAVSPTQCALYPTSALKPLVLQDFENCAAAGKEWLRVHQRPGPSGAGRSTSLSLCHLLLTTRVTCAGCPRRVLRPSPALGGSGTGRGGDSLHSPVLPSQS